ncbi:Laminin A family protein [Trichomonas vaginalis G3]|uniref:Phospholipase B-like n=1 Tax=Trichomonas vaginalis (strain ATCC PRA-98 / G3) TaxID=412133 RepID=A2FH82_TRIV3|nr:phosphatidylinositol catabolic process [Trichomonas vaginalis G3]EAX95720.1 Laminin A family protein [Trichomonas vaginalis G3]KAI5549321.1 phosphatidylinositol catabolic process [Trichomonas vaginalis G3]|eukprot:XP_001308650.1 Laminin A family protein [Trichomonas vaginalis G3]
MFLFIQQIACAEKYREASCYIDNNGNPSIQFDKIDKNAVAWANFNDSIHEAGWYKLHLHGREGAPDADIMKCAGYIEGALSYNSIFNHYALIREIKGYPSGVRTYPPQVKEYMSNNLQYVRESVDAYPESVYWQEIGLIMNQFDGLVAGYKYACDLDHNETAQMDEFDHWFFQSAGDMFDIAHLFPDDVAPAREFINEHCSGLIRLTDDYRDVYFSHDAWSDYRELHGQLKEYDLPIKAFKAHKLVMSTRIGKLASYDDFYMADTGLFVLETTLNNYNDDLYKVCTPKSLFTWIRAVHATWTSTSGKEWTETFIKHNSGTYNNQYVVVDSKKLTRFQKPDKDLIWIIEQFPGVYRSSDVTDYLVEHGYFPSVNCPYHEDLYNLAGYPELVASLGIYGDYRSNYKSPRYLIMQRDVWRIKTFEDFKKFMRYNQWKRDNYSQGDPAQQIASRYDLRPAEGTPYGDRNNFGDLDTKVLRLTEAVTNMRMHALASPPCDAEFNPPWEFGQKDFKVNYYGLPTRWNFTWVDFQAEGYDICAAGNKNMSKCLEINEMCGYCQYSEVCTAGDKTGPWFGVKCEDGWKLNEPLQPWAKAVIIPTSLIIFAASFAILAIHFINKKKTLLPK